jgi:uncharacterized protein
MNCRADGFDWDEGNWPKCAKHGLSKTEIEYALRHDPLVLMDRRGRAEQRFNAVGWNKEGRHLFVVFTVRVVNAAVLIRPISARYMHEKEVKAYEKTKKA